MVVSRCKYLRQIFECNFSAANLFQSNSAKHVHVDFTFSVCSHNVCTSHQSWLKVCSRSPEEDQCHGRAGCLLRQSGALWWHREARTSRRDLSPANPPSNRGGSRVPFGPWRGRRPDEDRSCCLSIYLLSSNAGWSHHFIFSSWWLFLEWNRCPSLSSSSRCSHPGVTQVTAGVTTPPSCPDLPFFIIHPQVIS